MLWLGLCYSYSSQKLAEQATDRIFISHLNVLINKHLASLLLDWVGLDLRTPQWPLKHVTSAISPLLSTPENLTSASLNYLKQQFTARLLAEGSDPLLYDSKIFTPCIYVADVSCASKIHIRVRIPAGPRLLLLSGWGWHHFDISQHFNPEIFRLLILEILFIFLHHV